MLCSEMIRQRLLCFLIVLSFVVSIFYKSSEYRQHLVRNLLHQIQTSNLLIYKGTEDFLINTTGCIIPNYSKTFKVTEIARQYKNCGDRAVFVDRTNDNITFTIDVAIINKYYNKNKHKFDCCYKTVTRSKEKNYEDKKINYSKCQSFTNKATVPHDNEVYTVTCTETNKSKTIYEDAYLILRKQKSKPKPKENNWNVLIIGLDTMSRGRLMTSMPKTAQYLKSNHWLDFRGYQKVGYNTFPNLVAFLTGKVSSTIYKECSLGMYQCNHLMIWSHFRNAGYMTAYAEDNLGLPDTFSRNNGFKTIPTDHYTRPFFLIGEKPSGNFICTKHQTSTKHILNYAYDFVNAYKNVNFFGTFWINTISHNEMYLPTLHDDDIVNFFKNISTTGVMQNTFIIFLSDHGIRYTKSRVTVGSYYEERLPMLHIWAPLDFQKEYKEEYNNLQINQNRLVTPYDLHLTFQNILNFKMYKKNSGISEACPQCTSIFQEVPDHRTCKDVGVNEKWCSCHEMAPIEITNSGANASIRYALSYIQNKSQTVQTKQCMTCHSFTLQKVLRIHTYRHNNKVFYVIAFRVKPGNIDYEANIVEENDKYEIIDSVYSISSYNHMATCVKNRYDTPFCVCMPDKKCLKHKFVTSSGRSD